MTPSIPREVFGSIKDEHSGSRRDPALFAGEEGEGRGAGAAPALLSGTTCGASLVLRRTGWFPLCVLIEWG